MKKLILILLCLLLLLTAFWGCDKKEPAGEPTEEATEEATQPAAKELPDSVLYDGELYSYERIEGQYYIVIKDIGSLPNLPEKYPPHIEGTSALALAPPSPKFTSFDDLYNAIRYTGLDDEDLAYLYYYQNPNKSNKIKVFNFDNLYVPAFPDSLKDYQKLLWYGETYIWYINEVNGENKISVSMNEITEEKYTETVNEMFDFSKGDFSESTNAIGVKEYYYKKQNKKETYIVYELKNDNTTYVVKEEYASNSSNDTPSYIAVVVKQDHGYYMFSIRGLNARPHYAWITAFGMELYKYGS